MPTFLNLIPMGGGPAGGRDEHLASGVGVAHLVGRSRAVERHALDGAASRQGRPNMQGTGEPGRHCGRPGVTTVRGCDVDRACTDPDGGPRNSRLARRDAR